MKPADLIANLRELERRGWSVEVAPKTGISDSPHIRFVEPQAGHIGGLNITLHKPLPWDAQALVTGWLVAQLEARGLRRAINQYVGGLLDMYLLKTDGEVVCMSERYSAELPALIECCLALGEGKS